MTFPSDRTDSQRLVAVALVRLAGEVGSEALTDPDRLRALLLDDLGPEAQACRRELRLICDVASEGIAARLVHGPSPDHGVLADELATSTGLAPGPARWAVDAFASAVRPDSPAAASTPDVGPATEPLVFDPDTGEDSAPLQPATIAAPPPAPTDSPADAGPPPPPRPAGGDDDEARRRRVAALAIAVAVIAIAGIVGAVIAFSGDGGDDDESVKSKAGRSGTVTSGSTTTTEASTTTAIPSTTAAPTTQATTPVTQTQAQQATLKKAIPPAMTGCATASVAGAQAGFKCALNGGQPQVTYGLFASNSGARTAFDQLTADLPLPVTNPECGGSAPSGINGWHYHVDPSTLAGKLGCHQEGNTAVFIWNDGRIVASASLMGDSEAHHPLGLAWKADSLGPWGGRAGPQERGICDPDECQKAAP